MASGVRRRRNTAPTSENNGEQSIIRYQAMGTTIGSDASGLSWGFRYYVPGLQYGLVSATGPGLVSFYSTAKFLPGTSIRWEPSCSFTTTGRIYVGFTDNPEVATTLTTLSGTAFGNAVKGMGSVMSFPVWQETNISFPTRLRRKRFDVNGTVAASSDVLDRSSQTNFFWYLDGAPVSLAGLGSFWYKDVVSVEGMNNLAT